jgi:hypothetical protein
MRRLCIWEGIRKQPEGVFRGIEIIAMAICNQEVRCVRNPVFDEGKPKGFCMPHIPLVFFGSECLRTSPLNLVVESLIERSNAASKECLVRLITGSNFT